MEKIDEQKILSEVIDRMRDIMKLQYSDIPNIDLYMDQVLTFMDDKLSPAVREGKEDNDHILTKTMINNYAKNDLLPPPVKKKYNREHMVTLILIYYFKSYMSINDIQTLITPLTDNHFEGVNGASLGEIYEIITKRGNEKLGIIEHDIIEDYESSMKLFDKCEEEDREYLQLFSFVCSLSYDIFIRQMLVNRTIDEMNRINARKEEERKAREKENRKRK